jgi:hypothetical protein
MLLCQSLLNGHLSLAECTWPYALHWMAVVTRIKLLVLHMLPKTLFMFVPMKLLMLLPLLLHEMFCQMSLLMLPYSAAAAATACAAGRRAGKSLYEGPSNVVD